MYYYYQEGVGASGEMRYRKLQNDNSANICGVSAYFSKFEYSTVCRDAH